jgi:hypothetical protein
MTDLWPVKGKKVFKAGWFKWCCLFLVQGDTQKKGGTFERPNKNRRNPTKFYGNSTLLTVPLIHDYNSFGT